jgi:lipid-binding SYLF domain-containing protein
MLVMNESGKGKLLSSKFTIGAEASAAAGPVGRETRAQTDAQMRAEILTWSRARGAFAGVSLQGASLREDADVNKTLYGKPVTNKEIAFGKIDPPDAAKELLALFNTFSPKEVTK